MFRVLTLSLCFAALLVASPLTAKGKRYPVFTTDDVSSVDVVVALGVKPPGALEPSAGMLSNLTTAVELYHAGRARWLMVCGGYTGGHISEADMMKILAQGMGVPADRILVEDGSHDTKENAKNAGILAQRNGLRSGILVAQEGHVQRASREFDAAGVFRDLLPVIGAPTDLRMLSCEAAGTLTQDRYDAIVVHGASPGFDFTRDPLEVDRNLAAVLTTAAAFYHQGKARKVLLWHDLAARGHVARTEAMAILLAGMGVPPERILRSPSRRYGGDNRVGTLLTNARVRDVVTVVPEDGVSLEDLRTAYEKADVAADVLMVCRP